MIGRFLARWLINAAALWAATELIAGVAYDGEPWTLVTAALVLSLANAVVRPLVTLLALPLVILTLGFALFFINLLMLVLTAQVVGEFTIDGFWPAVWATVIVWLVNTALDTLFEGRRRAPRRRAPERAR